MDGIESPTRVILVGRTGLDAKLRLDPRLELVRVTSPLEAVGELSEPIDTADPWPSVVFVADDVAQREPGVGRAAHEVDPKVRVYRVGQGPAEDGYDGCVGLDATAEALRQMVHAVQGPENGTAHTHDQNGESEADGTLESVVESILEPRGASDGVGDALLVRLLMRGTDIRDAAMSMLRRRLGVSDIELIDSAPSGAEVSYRGRCFGVLRSGQLQPEQLAPWASWLGAWLGLNEQHTQLRDAAFTDSLTGAWNRRYFERFLGSAIERAQVDRRSVMVMVFDIDDFKKYNDRYGHAAGDEILKETVRLLRSVIRPTDRVCRIGGDEFVVVFDSPEGPRVPTSTPPQDVYEIAQRFQSQVRQKRFSKLGNEAPGTLTISGGLAAFPWDGRTPDELLARADELALASKAKGKNAITFGPDSASLPSDTDEPQA